MRKWLLVLLGIECGVACSDSKSCTFVACDDETKIVLQLVGGLTPAVLELELDGRSVTCTVPPLSEGTAGTCDDGLVSVAQRMMPVCADDSSDAGSCQVVHQLHQTIIIRAAPVRAVVTATAADGASQQQTVDIRYRTFQPNGEDCAPICQLGTATVSLPGSSP